MIQNAIDAERLQTLHTVPHGQIFKKCHCINQSSNSISEDSSPDILNIKTQH